LADVSNNFKTENINKFMGLTGLSDVTIKNFNISSADITTTPVAP
jgi:hypothetical protein